MMSSQRGMGFVGAFILVIAVVAGYYIYKAVMDDDRAPSCKGVLTACMQNCRRTTTEAPAALACQEACSRDADACERKSK